MSETNNAPAPDDQAPGGSPSPADEGAENAPEAIDVAGLRREAASYRRQLRGAESERDQLREQLDGRDRADAERLAGRSMANGGDLFVAGVELAALRDDDGALSPELVTLAVERVLADRPHWRRQTSGFDGGARAPIAVTGPSFGEALKNPHRRA